MTVEPRHGGTVNAPVLVRVAPEILELLASEGSAPVVVLGINEQDDGTHDMVLRSARVFLLLYQWPFREQVDVEAVYSSREAAEQARDAADEPEQYSIEERDVRHGAGGRPGGVGHAPEKCPWALKKSTQCRT